MQKPTLDNTHPVMRAILWVEWVGLTLIAIATIYALGHEVFLVIKKHRVELHDILLFFIYLEIMTMVALYFTSGKLPVRYPIYIAIVAIARYIILDLEKHQSIDIMWMAVSVLLLTLGALVLRYGHAKLPYQEKID